MHTTKENGPNNNITLKRSEIHITSQCNQETHTQKKIIHLPMAFIIVQCISDNAKVVRRPDVTGILFRQRP